MISYLLRIWTIIIFFVILILAILTCERNRITGPEKPKPQEIKWQQTALDSVAFNVFADPYTGVIYANHAPSYKGELLRSFDKGETWNIAFANVGVFKMAFRDNGDIFAFHNYSEGTSLFRSSNGGDTWDRFVSRPPINPHALVFHPSGYIFLGYLGPLGDFTGDIYRSSDDGITWEETTFPDSLGVYSMIINNEGDTFAGTNRGIYRSTDIGNSWLAVNEGLRAVDGRPPSIIDFAINPVNNNIFAVAALDKVYRSTDNGDSWQLTEPVLQNNSAIFDLLINSRGGIFVAVLNNNRGPESGRGVFYSNDNGENWQQVNIGLTNTNIFGFVIDPSGFLYAAVVNDGVFRTAESTTE